MKLLLMFLLTFIITGCSYSFALSDSVNNSVSLALPNAGSSYASDKFDSGQLSCSNALASSTTMEIGTTTIVQSSTENRGRVGDLAIYARITFPLGKRLKGARINCNTLFELEMRKKRLEVQLLQQEINKLKELSFEN